MLIDVAVLTSAALGPVAEAFVVHEISRHSTVQVATMASHDILPTERAGSGRAVVSLVSFPMDASTFARVPTEQPGPVIGPQPVTQTDTQRGSQPVEQVSSIRALKELALLSGPDISKYVAAHPDAIGSLLASPPPPRDVTLWWASLDPGARSTLGSATPQLIGNLEGIPVQVRDGANRTVLSSTINSLDRLVSSDAGRSVIENARQQLKMLQSISDALDGVATGDPSDVSPSDISVSATARSAGTLASDPVGNTVSHADEASRTLLTLDVAGQGRAAIVLGNLETADYVTYLVPGMFFTIENQMGAWAEAADELYEQQLEWLSYFDSRSEFSSGQSSSAQPGSEHTSVATVAWIGYHTPNLTNVGGIQNADEGRDALASAIKGLQSLRAADEPYITVIAHSYGSTAALMALTEYDFEVDALALVGSPGSPAKSVDDLHVRGGNVYVGEGAWDPIPNSSYFGSDPGAASYGARHMSVAGGKDSLTGEPLLASNGHNEYFSPGTESMRNFALISIGKGQFVTGDGAVVLAKASGTSK
ncbi:hypothetical protein IWX81_000120 [Salinibacterium sp. CAN_S4]|uniref:alpha/beta hydrolase n=1 Tax=Salinibacterium sp. CAN_S4 TaxID=2787727 RepID=UPI001A22DBC7